MFTQGSSGNVDMENQHFGRYIMSKISEIIENKKHYDGITLVERMKECHTSAVSIAIIENF